MRNAHFSDFPHILSCSQRCVEESPGVSFPSVPWDDFLHEEILQQNRRAKSLHRVLTSAQKTTNREAGPRGGGRVWGERRRRRLPGGLPALWRQPRGGRAAAEQAGADGRGRGSGGGLLFRPLAGSRRRGRSLGTLGLERHGFASTRGFATDPFVFLPPPRRLPSRRR